jgi:hypothetical protein
VHVGFVADSVQMVNSAHAEALAAGAIEIHRTATSLRSSILCGASHGLGRLQPGVRLQKLAARE